jgi:hypothetical protein
MKNRGPDGMRNLRPQKLSFQDKRRVLDMYREGMSMVEIGKIFGVGKTAIHYFLHTRGEPTRPRHLHPQRYNGITGPKPGGQTVADRDEQGIIVTLRRQDTMELHAMHIAGKTGDALLYLAEKIDASGIPWRLLCYSTPRLIASDMQGGRTIVSKSGSTIISNPEASALGSIDRLDLLDPRVAIGDIRKKAQEKKRRRRK